MPAALKMAFVGCAGQTSCCMVGFNGMKGTGEPGVNSANGLDFARLRDHSPANFNWEGALWRRKRCLNFREW
jgi:hypothetical protein